MRRVRLKTSRVIKTLNSSSCNSLSTKIYLKSILSVSCRLQERGREKSLQIFTIFIQLDFSNQIIKDRILSRRNLIPCLSHIFHRFQLSHVYHYIFSYLFIYLFFNNNLTFLTYTIKACKHCQIIINSSLRLLKYTMARDVETSRRFCSSDELDNNRHRCLYSTYEYSDIQHYPQDITNSRSWSKV